MPDHVDALSPAGVSELATFIIRPPRAHYLRHDLGEPLFTIDDVRGRRDDLTLTNDRGLTLHCSQFRRCRTSAPTVALSDLPTVIYLHGNGSCRVEATVLLPLTVPYGINVFALDLSGSGRSGGEYISLGVWERHDVSTAVAFLKTQGVTSIILWGHSMGAATALMYAGLQNLSPLVKGIVLDSPFASFDKLAQSMVNEMPLPPGVPKKLVLTVGVRAIRKLVRERAGFDVHDIDALSAAKKAPRNLPALFIHGTKDNVVPHSHGELLHSAYAGSKKLWLPLDGLEHDTPRPMSALDRAFEFILTAVSSGNGPQSSSTTTLSNGDASSSLNSASISKGSSGGASIPRSISQPSHMAVLDALKLRGNSALTSARFADAVFLYTRALQRLVRTPTPSQPSPKKHQSSSQKRSPNSATSPSASPTSTLPPSQRSASYAAAPLTAPSFNPLSRRSGPSGAPGASSLSDSAYRRPGLLVKRWRTRDRDRPRVRDREKANTAAGPASGFSIEDMATITDDESVGTSSTWRRGNRKSRDRARRRASTDVSARWAATAAATDPVNGTSNDRAGRRSNVNSSNGRSDKEQTDAEDEDDLHSSHGGRFSRQKSWRASRVVERLRSFRKDRSGRDKDKANRSQGGQHDAQAQRRVGENDENFNMANGFAPSSDMSKQKRNASALNVESIVNDDSLSALPNVYTHANGQQHPRHHHSTGSRSAHNSSHLNGHLSSPKPDDEHMATVRRSNTLSSSTHIADSAQGYAGLSGRTSKSPSSGLDRTEGVDTEAESESVSERRRGSRSSSSRIRLRQNQRGRTAKRENAGGNANGNNNGAERWRLSKMKPLKKNDPSNATQSANGKKGKGSNFDDIDDSDDMSLCDMETWQLDPRGVALALALLGNRSLARRKLGDLPGALADADRSLRLDDAWPRGYVRKATALRDAGRVTEAKAVAIAGLKKDPLHAGLNDLVRALDELLIAPTNNNGEGGKEKKKKSTKNSSASAAHTTVHLTTSATAIAPTPSLTEGSANAPGDNTMLASAQPLGLSKEAVVE